MLRTVPAQALTPGEPWPALVITTVLMVRESSSYRAEQPGLVAVALNVENTSPQPWTAEHVRADLGDEVGLILDGSPCTVGVESTIVDLSGKEPAVLRPGGLAVEELERVLGRKVPVRTSATVRVSGSLASHYAPRAVVVLSEPADVGARVTSLRARGHNVGVLGPPGLMLPPGVPRYEVPEDPAGAARALYTRLREADEQGHDMLVACLPRAEGLGIAVRDRLARAAAPRSSGG